MAFAPDARIGSYQITAQIGAGGMGEVYRARDTSLDRDVAIKVLPEAFAQDPERLARFEREAKTLAALNHPNIAQIYGLERSGSITALVMELVEGETLATDASIAVDEALALAKQIALAIEVAHEQGIIHRDLKPANIKVRADGTVKVLDFGLAKAFEPASAVSAEQDPAYGITQSPTLTIQATQAGLILGTAAYMSPEQARGRSADKRADIWSFGVVLFEMLSGGRLFEGEDVSETLAFVLTKTPEWTRLPATVPPAIVTLLKRCLERDRRRRVADMSTVRFVIEEAGSLVAVRSEAKPSEVLAPMKPLWLRLAPIATAVVLTAAIAGASAWTLWPRTRPLVARFLVTLPPGQSFTGIGRRVVALSPDGTTLVYSANNRFFMRPIASLDASPLGDGDLPAISPVFSPDGQSIAFWAQYDGTLKRVAVSGGSPVTVCPTESPIGIWWDKTGIIFGAGPRGIMRCPERGGQREVFVKMNTNESAGFPQLLPDGDSLLFAVGPTDTFVNTSATPSDDATIAIESLRSHTRTKIVAGATGPRYVETGHLLYVQRGTLLAGAFNPAQPNAFSGSVAVLEGVRRFPGIALSPQYDVSRSGSLAYIPGPTQFGAGQVSLVIEGQDGKVTRVLQEARAFEHPRVSRNGKFITYATKDGQDANVFAYEIGTSSSPRRLTTFGGRNLAPVLSVDGSRVAYQSNKDGDLAIFAQRFDGTSLAERLTKPASGVSHVPESWSPDGRYLSFDEVNGPDHTLCILSVADGKVTVTDVHSIEPLESSFSPDGKWIVYSVRPAGADPRSPNRGNFVRPFPIGGPPQQLPKVNVDFHPVWANGGKELVYVATAASSQFVRVSVAATPSLTFGTPTRFIAPVQDRVSTDRRDFDVMPDGRLIGVVSADRSDAASPVPTEIRVVLNWTEELKSRVPTR